MANEHMLTTLDNPFSPVTQFDEWFAFDEAAGHHTLPYLARVTVTSYELSEADQGAAIEDAINEIIQENINGLYIKVPVNP